MVRSGNPRTERTRSDAERVLQSHLAEKFRNFVLETFAPCNSVIPQMGLLIGTEQTVEASHHSPPAEQNGYHGNEQ